MSTIQNSELIYKKNVVYSFTFGPPTASIICRTPLICAPLFSA